MRPVSTPGLLRAPPRPSSPVPAAPAGTPGAGSHRAGTGSRKSQRVWFPLGPLPGSLPGSRVLTRPLCGAGLVAVFDSHRQKGSSDLYSLHSWAGLLVFVLYLVQVTLRPHGAGGGGGTGAPRGPAFRARA